MAQLPFLRPSGRSGFRFQPQNSRHRAAVKSPSERRSNGLSDNLHVHGGLKASQHLPLAVHQELGEVPLDIGLVAEGFVVHIGELAKRGILQALAEAFKGFFRGKVHEERVSIVTIHVNLGKLREFGTKLQGAEFMNLVLRAGGLIGKLVAGEIQDLQALILHFFVHGLQGLIMRGKSAASGSVHNQENLPLIFGEAYLAALSVLHGKIIYGAHAVSPFNLFVFEIFWFSSSSYSSV